MDGVVHDWFKCLGNWGYIIDQSIIVNGSERSTLVSGKINGRFMDDRKQYIDLG